MTAVSWLLLLACVQTPDVSWQRPLAAPAEPSLAAITPGREETDDEWRQWMATVDAEPELPFGLQVALAPVDLAVEGAAWLFFPRHVQFNGLVVFDQGATDEHFATILLRTFLKRETAFLASLSTSGLSTTSVELGYEQVDMTRFNGQQSKVIADSLKRAYRERFNVPRIELDTILSTVKTGEWIDWVVVPAAVSAYTARFGIERTWRVGDDVAIRFNISKGTWIYRAATSEMYGRLASFSIRAFDLPLCAIVVIDGGAGRLDFGFIGIGTDLGAAFEAINGAKGPHED